MLKDGSIWIFLGQLAKKIDSQRYQVVDHWDADLCAVGIAAVEDMGRLVYVSTYSLDPGQYSVECEIPDEDDPIGYRVAARREDIPLDEVVAMIRCHLPIPDSDGALP